MRSAIDLAYRARRLALRWLRWRTRGVKVMVFDEAGELLLIRNRYGNRAAWLLPGGGVARGETPEHAARREVVEETGCVVTNLVAVGTFVHRAEGKRDTVHLFRGTTADAPIPDLVEIAEARFFAPDRLPEGVSPATRRRIDEAAGRRLPNGEW